MKTLKNFLPVFIFLFSLQIFAQIDSTASLTVKDFKERISNKDSTMVILDVRTYEEVKGSLPKIDGAIHIPVQEIRERFNELEKYKDKEIIVVCRTQNRSSKAAAFLNKKGYNAKSVTGGMQEYYKESK
jgi:rhodanese-related sulfurtransferase